MPDESPIVIVAETEAGFRLVTQPDHAALAGQFADHWGNGEFASLEPRAATVLAAYHHDDGWLAYDRHPHLGEDGTPIDFRSVAAEPWIDLYDEGTEAIAEADPYAGLLVSMHGAGLRRQRYGLSPNWPPTRPAFLDFVSRQEELQRELAGALLESGPHGRISETDVELLSALHETGSIPEGADSRLWRNYELLQAWDTLSLSFCTTVSPPSYGEIDSVPVDGAGSEETLSIEPLGDDAFRVEPYPFDTDPLVVSMPARTVRNSAFDDEESLFRAYYEASLESRPFTLRGGDR